MSEKTNQEMKRTAGEAGWHLSRYNLRSRLPETGETVIVNLYAQTITKFHIYFLI